MTNTGRNSQPSEFATWLSSSLQNTTPRKALENPAIPCQSHPKNIELLASLPIFKKTSVNCLHSTKGGIFTKLQLPSLYVDPLENEVAITKIINMICLENIKYEHIYAEYVNHFVVKYDNTNHLPTNIPEVTSNTEYKILQIRAINCIPAFEYYKSKLNSTEFFMQVRDLIENHASFAEATGMVHNDAHFNNIVYDKTQQKFKLLDYGRACLPLDTMTKYFNALDETAQGFCIKPNDVINIVTEHKFNHIMDSEIGYMCDIATLCINTMRVLGATFWENYMKMIGMDWFEISGQHITIHNPQLIVIPSKDNWIARGLTFLALYLVYAHKERYRKKGQTTFTFQLQQKKGEEYNKDAVYGGYLHPNGVFKSEIFNTVCNYLKRRWDTQQGGMTKTRRPADHEIQLPAPMNDKERQIPDYMLKPTLDYIMQDMDEIYKIGGRHQSRPDTPSYKLSTERGSNRKYALIKRTRIYLDENRGRFKFANQSKTEITLRTKKA